MAPIAEVDLSKVRTVPIERRPNKVAAAEFASPPGRDRSFSAFLKSLPDVLVARDFLRVVNAIAGGPQKRARGGGDARRAHREDGTRTAPHRPDESRRDHPPRDERLGRDPRLRDRSLRRDIGGRGAWSGRRHFRDGGRNRPRHERGVRDRHEERLGDGRSAGARARGGSRSPIPICRCC